MATSSSIVFPTDFSENSINALAWAKRLSAMLDAELHCIFIVEQPTVYGTVELAPVALPTTQEMEEAAALRLRRFVDEHMGGGGSGVVTRVVPGRPADEIVGYASENGASMIVMSTHGYSGLKHIVLGSTTEAVLRQAKCPVLAVPRSDT